MIKKYRKPYRIKKKKSLFKNRYFWRGILVLILIGEITYFMFVSPFFQIKKIKALGNEKVKTEDLTLFIPTKSIFLVNLNKVKEEILKGFPQIENIELEKNLPSGISLAVKERDGVADFCVNNTCFLVDKEGVVFENILEENNLLKIEKRNQISFKFGDKVLDEKVLDLALAMDVELKKIGVSVGVALVLSEDRLNIETAEGWQIYLNPQKDAAWQVTKMKAVLENEIPQNRRKNLEYIELRFDNFAPYKYK